MDELVDLERNETSGDSELAFELAHDALQLSLRILDLNVFISAQGSSCILSLSSTWRVLGSHIKRFLLAFFCRK